jgi:predicted RNase H-like HicB family nuclease
VKFVVTLTNSEDGYVVAECPGLPGCFSQGKTRQEAIENIREAILLSVETRKAHNLPITVETEEVEVPV